MAQAMLLKPHMGAWCKPCGQAGRGEAGRSMLDEAAQLAASAGRHGRQHRRHFAAQAAATSARHADALPYARPCLHVDKDVMAADVLLYRARRAVGRRRRLDLGFEVVVGVVCGAAKLPCHHNAACIAEAGQDLGSGGLGEACTGPRHVPDRVYRGGASGGELTCTLQFWQSSATLRCWQKLPSGGEQALHGSNLQATGRTVAG